MKNIFTSPIKALVAVIISLSALSLSASAQEAKAVSRVAVVANETSTRIWVSDFPKNATIVIMDSEDKLVAMTTTNEYGAAFVNLPAGANTKMTVKTLDDEVVASNYANELTQHDESLVFSDDDDTTIA